MATTKEKWQEIADRGLQDKFDPDTRSKFDEAVRRGLITLPSGTQPLTQEEVPATPGLGQQVIGALENVGALVSGAVAEPLAGIAGIGSALLPGGKTPTQAIESTREALTFQPKTEAGQSQQQAIGKALAPIGEALSGLESTLGQQTLDLTGSPLLASVAHSLPTAALEAIPSIAAFKQTRKTVRAKSLVQEEIANKIQQGTADKAFVDKIVDGAGKVVKDKASIETQKQGFDSGVIAAVKGSSPTDKQAMLRMVDTLEKGRANALFAANNRPADVAGDSLLRKVNFVKKNNIDAGRQLSRVAKRLKGKDVDIDSPLATFFDDAENLGVSFDENLKPNFDGSRIETIPPAKKLIRDIALKIRRKPTPDAFEAHDFKKFIDENVTFGKSAKGLGGETERIAKKLRTNVDSALDETFPEYNEANTRFADTIKAIDALQDSAGQKVNLFGKNAEKATGTVLRRLMSNTQSRVNLIDAIQEIENVGRKYGGNFADDILTQMLFADELDSMFGSAARTSFKGQIEQAVSGVARKTASERALDVAGGLAEKVRGINDENAIISIKKLLKGEK